MSSNIDLGLVTAYGYAVDAGFTGTEAEFAQMLANVVVYKNAAETAANNAALSAGLAEQYKDEAFDTTPAGYTDFVSETNSSLDYLVNSGVKNLLYNSKVNKSSVINDITFTKNDDGTITANGTLNGDYAFYEFITKSEKPYIGRHKLVCQILGGTISGGLLVGQVCYKDTSEASWSTVVSKTMSTTNQVGSFEFPDNKYSYCIRAYVQTNGAVLTNLRFKIMIVDESVTDYNTAHFAENNAILTKNLNVLTVQQFTARVSASSTDSIFDYFTIEKLYAYLIILRTSLSGANVGSVYLITIDTSGNFISKGTIFEDSGASTPIIDSNNVLKLKSGSSTYTVNGTVLRLC